MNSKRIITKTVLLSVAMAGAMTSCQKDEFQSEILVSQEMSLKNKAHVNTTLRYWIDGVEYQMEFSSFEEMQNYISDLIELSHKGCVISIKGSDNPSLAPEPNDKLTFQTSDKAELDVWLNDMSKKGYNVEFYFDKERGLYIGTATKGGSRTTMATNLSEERE